MPLHHDEECRTAPWPDNLKLHLTESPLQYPGSCRHSSVSFCNVSPLVRQVVASLSASTLMFFMMVNWAFPAIALPQMALPGSPINFTTEQNTWFASMPFLMNIPGNLMAGPLCEWLGPRRLMLCLTPVLCGSSALLGAATSLKAGEAAAVSPELFLILTRILQTALQAVVLPVIIIYIYEVCDARRRGTMIPVQDSFASFGFPVCYLAGCFLDWPVLAWLTSLLAFGPIFFGLLVSPESPAWLFKKGKQEAANRSLTQLRCSQEEIIEEIMAIEKSCGNDPGCSTMLLLLKKRSNALAMTVSVLLLFLKELSGIGVMTVFIVKIFELAAVGLDPCWSSVIVGLTMAVFKGLASVILHHSPRKPLLVLGSIVAATGTASIGVFFLLQSSGAEDAVSGLGWLPLLSAFVFMVGYAGALGPASWTVSMEILPGSVRCLGFGLGSAFYAAAALIVTKMFENGDPAMTLHGAFFSYATATIVQMLFVLSFVIETRGRSLRDIEVYWETFNK